MLADRIEAKWIDAFCEIFERCAVKAGDTAAILSETQSRALNVHLAELALLRMGARPFHVVMPTPRNRHIVPVRSTGASEAIQQLGPVVTALQQAGFVVDCTIEGLMHAAETPEILKAGARILVISNEHPGGAGADGAGPGAGEARSRGGEDAARDQADAGHLEGRHAISTSTWSARRRSACGAGPTSPARWRIGRAASSSASPRAARSTARW